MCVCLCVCVCVCVRGGGNSQFFIIFYFLVVHRNLALKGYCTVFQYALQSLETTGINSS